MSGSWDKERKKLAAVPGAIHDTHIGTLPGRQDVALVEIPWPFAYALDWFWGTGVTVELRDDGVFISARAHRDELAGQARAGEEG